MTELIGHNQGYGDGLQNFETHSLKKLKHSSKGTTVDLEGNGTHDDDVPLIVGVAGFSPKGDVDLEVHTHLGSQDQNSKFATMSIPHDKQRDWNGDSGVQSWNDPTRALVHNDKRTYIDDKKGFATKGGAIEDDGNGNVIIRGNLIVQGNFSITGNFSVAGTITSPNIPQTPLPSGPAPVIITVPAFSE
jgi:hypothetical protein